MSDEVVTLREITSANEADVRALRVAPDQERFVSSVADSLEDPQARPWFRAIYAGERPVGFVMLSYDMPPGDPEQPFRYFLWRLLIDAGHQGHGYGRAAVTVVIDQLRGRPGATELVTSVHPGAGSPAPFYRAMGFEPTGDWLEGEEIYQLTLEPDPEA
ncbi:MAG TPA: GNAT family N-acetyltransferase [Actinomycetota bacterium]